MKQKRARHENQTNQSVGDVKEDFEQPSKLRHEYPPISRMRGRSVSKNPAEMNNDEYEAYLAGKEFVEASSCDGVMNFSSKPVFDEFVHIGEHEAVLAKLKTATDALKIYDRLKRDIQLVIKNNAPTVAKVGLIDGLVRYAESEIKEINQ